MRHKHDERQKLKICKEWILVDNSYKKTKEKHKLESVINEIHTELGEILLIYNLIKKELDMHQVIDE